jgi:hypothetical protein
VDFIDDDKKIVIEIKPNKERKKEKNIIKEKYLLEWCKINDYKYHIITEEYFKQYNWNESLIKDQPDYKRLSNPKFKKYFIYED